MNLLNLLIASWDRLTNEGLAARSIIRARARTLTQRPYTDPQSIPLLIITERGANEENNDQRLKLNNPLDEGQSIRSELSGPPPRTLGKKELRTSARPLEREVRSHCCHAPNALRVNEATLPELEGEVPKTE